MAQTLGGRDSKWPKFRVTSLGVPQCLGESQGRGIAAERTGMQTPLRDILPQESAALPKARQ